MSEMSEFERERRQKADKLRALGIDPFGGPEAGLMALAEARNLYKQEMGHDGGPVVKSAGRIVLKRDMGKLSFLTLRDGSGDLQVALDKKRLSETEWQIRGLLDLGDQIVVEGPVGVTNKGETTIWAARLSMGSKALLPPPAKWEGLSDMELRYRRRYVDLFANPQVMRLFQLRSRVLEEMRAFLRGRGYVEVETPMMQPLAGGAAARPFVTHHNALDIPLYLRIAPELYLKRLLVGGFSKVFELNRNFRNEGISPRHNPEFTMLEAYEAYGSWETMAEMVESLVCHLAETLLGGLRIVHHGDTEGTEKKVINLQRPWRRVHIVELVKERTGWAFDKRPLSADQIAELRTQNPGKDLKLNGGPAEQLVEVYEKLIEPTLIDPTFVTHIPSVIIPLARKDSADPFFADVYELAVNGQELSPGYSELNDPDIQAANFAHQVGDEEEKQKMDHDFLNALRHGMPPAGGMGLGVDRLMTLLTGAPSLRDVILFPLMKPVETGT